MIKNYDEQEQAQIKELTHRIDTGADMMGEWLSELFKIYTGEEFPGENEWFGSDFTRMLGYLWALQTCQDRFQKKSGKHVQALKQYGMRCLSNLVFID